MCELLAGDRSFETLISWSARGTRLSVRGELDLGTAADLRARLGRAVEHGGPVSVHLAAVTFIDAAGLRVLADAGASSGDHGREIILTAPSAPVRRILSLAGLDWSDARTQRRSRPGDASRTRSRRAIRATRHGRRRRCPPAPGHRHVWRKGYYLGEPADWACMVCGRAAPRLAPVGGDRAPAPPDAGISAGHPGG